MNKQFYPGPRFALSMSVISVFAVLGFWGSILHYLSWPIALIFGFGSAPHIKQRHTTFLAFGWMYLSLMIWCGLAIGGLPIWLIAGLLPATQSPPERMLSGLLGDAIMASLFVLGVGCFHAYCKAKQIVTEAFHSGT